MSVPTAPKRDIAAWLFWSGIAVGLLTLAKVFFLSIRDLEQVQVPIGPAVLMGVGALIFGVGFGMDLMSRHIALKIGNPQH